MPWFQIAVLILQADIKQLLKQSAYFIQFNPESAGWNVVELQTMVLTRFWLTNRSHEFFHSCQVSVTQSASKIQTRTQKNPLWCAFEVPAQALRNAERVRKTPQGDPAKSRGSLVRNACNGPHFSMLWCWMRFQLSPPQYSRLTLQEACKFGDLRAVQRYLTE